MGARDRNPGVEKTVGWRDRLEGDVAVGLLGDDTVGFLGLERRWLDSDRVSGRRLSRRERLTEERELPEEREPELTRGLLEEREPDVARGLLEERERDVAFEPPEDRELEVAFEPPDRELDADFALASRCCAFSLAAARSAGSSKAALNSAADHQPARRLESLRARSLVFHMIILLHQLCTVSPAPVQTTNVMVT